MTIALTPTLSRRTFLSTAGRAVLGVAGAAALASCSDRSSAPPFDWTDQSKAGVLDFANWPYYIDRTSSNDHPSLDAFTDRTGIRVNYSRPIRDDAEFLDRIRPDLEAGRPTGYDLVVITNGPQFSALMREDWAVPLDHSYLPNFSQYASDLVRNPPWDPSNRFSVAWQSGVTGIAYRPEAVRALGRKPDSVLDLWNRSLARRVGMMSDLMDLGSTALLAIGVEPESSGPDDWTAAAEFLERQHDEGIVRAYYDQSYLHALQSGDTWISQAWSGDIFQARRQGHRELEFVVPSEGAVFWTDNLLIPAHSRHPVDALIYMNDVYRPQTAAMIARSVGYVTPVPDARTILRGDPQGATLARSSLVFPSTDSIGRTSAFKAYPTFRTVEAERAWQTTFRAVLAL
ncbi:MAG: spermidine/putrescine ABC transporter substrate-binding protein [Actinomycetota bacterium]